MPVRVLQTNGTTEPDTISRSDINVLQDKELAIMLAKHGHDAKRPSFSAADSGIAALLSDGITQQDAKQRVEA